MKSAEGSTKLREGILKRFMLYPSPFCLHRRSKERSSICSMRVDHRTRQSDDAVGERILHQFKRRIEEFEGGLGALFPLQRMRGILQTDSADQELVLDEQLRTWNMRSRVIFDRCVCRRSPCIWMP